MRATTPDETRELDSRSSNGIDIRLLWRPSDDRALVEMYDGRTGETVRVEVRDGERALEVFLHPFAYAARASAAAAGAPRLPAG
jgi:hypothetical protein